MNNFLKDMENEGGKQMSKKKYDPFNAVMEHGTLTAGTIGAVGITGKMAQQLPSATGNKIVSSMDTMKVIPAVHGVAMGFGAFGSLKEVERKARKK